LKAGPLWLAGDIRAWHESTKGAGAPKVESDHLAEAIDLTAEPGRAEVFAHYGLAMAEAQMVEQHLATTLALLGVPDPYQSDMFLGIIQQSERKTMGQLKDALKLVGAPVVGVDQLKRVVDTRNVLAHRYFRDPERSLKMTTEKGRGELIEELDTAARDFHLIAQYLKAAEVRLAIQHGVSKSSVMQRLQAHRDGRTPHGDIARRAATLAHSPNAGASMAAAFDHEAD
jgi:hypothetical protein